MRPLAILAERISAVCVPGGANPFWRANDIFGISTDGAENLKNQEVGMKNSIAVLRGIWLCESDRLSHL
jgi:hypothetical protein